MTNHTKPRIRTAALVLSLLAALAVLTGCEANQGGAPVVGAAGQTGAAPAAGEAAPAPEVAEEPANEPHFAAIAENVPMEVAAAARTEMVAFLSSLMAADAPESLQLKEWTLQQLKFSEMRNDGTVFITTFDVMPASEQSHWAAGSGQAGENGWVDGKVQLLQVTGEEGNFELTRIGAA